ncbi:DUF418 domain-containing protein [Paenibacillus sp. CAU 1782]
MGIEERKQRIEVIDIVRGIALLGVFIINMRFFSTPYLAIAYQAELWPGFWDKLVSELETLFVAGKFISIFSFLFGFGMVLMLESAKKREIWFAPLITRRLLALALFGLLHGFLIWYGDILLHYALLGFLLLLFVNRKPRTLLISALALISLLPLLTLIGGGAGTFQLPDYFDSYVALNTKIYGEGSYSLILQQRIQEWMGTAPEQIGFYPHLLGMFLLGAFFARKKWFHRAEMHRVMLGKLCVAMLLLFTGLTTLTIISAKPWSDLAMLIGWPVGAMLYITAIVLVSQTEAGKKWLSPFAYVGRMAFTNYILQSVIGTLIFYGYGFGYFGQAGHVVQLLISICVFACQLLLSRLWLRRFRMGPLEWIWRVITYWTVPSMKSRG